MAERIEVAPNDDGTWRYQRRDGDVVFALAEVETRLDAITAARENADGLQVVILRADGSCYGEVHPAASTATGPPQRFTLTPVEVTAA